MLQYAAAAMSDPRRLRLRRRRSGQRPPRRWCWCPNVSKEVNLLLLGILPELGHSHTARQHLGKAYLDLHLGFGVHAPLADDFMGIAEWQIC